MDEKKFAESLIYYKISMFTGIITEIGKIKRFSGGASGAAVEISATQSLKNLKKGGSIAVDGICLTLTKVTERSFTADLSPETVEKTAARFFKAGRPVNLELPLAAGEPIGGHYLTGHVDGTAQIIKIEKKGHYLLISFQINPELSKSIVKKGSIAVDGISLTVNEINPNNFSVMLIPETIKNTTLAGKKLGELVNVETDLLLKPQVKNDVKENKPGLTLKKLEEAGFI
jgi:riboflavin synthase